MMERYEKYKDSGVEWIGEIPEGWEVKKLKYVVSINDEVLPESTEDNYELEYVDISNVKSGIGILCTETYSFKKAPSRARRIVRDGDIIVSTVRTYLKSISRIENPPENQIVSTGFAVVRPKTVESGYLGFLFYSEYLIGEIISRSTGVSYPAINASEVGCILITIPPLPDQIAIANYFDRKTAEIDELIAQKERLLELYEEEKNAIINQAVTKGIDPDVSPQTDIAHDVGVPLVGTQNQGNHKGLPLRDSGIDWIGDIPEGWEVKRLKYVASNLISGPFGSSLKKEVYVNEGYKIYGQEQVIKNDMAYGNYYISEEKYTEMSRYKITKHDILISCVGTFGKILLVPDEFQKGVINPRLIKLSPITDLIKPIFLTVLLKSPISFYQFDLLSRGGTMGVINLDLLKQLVFAIPPLPDQTAIVHHIETETTRINAKIAKTKRIIELQKEYRTALISEVVTGKIKVTGTQ